MRRQGRVVTRTMLLEGVWDYRFDPRTNVIDVHISRLRRKIDAEDEPRADPHRARQRLQARRRRLTARCSATPPCASIAAHLVLVAVSTALVLGFLYWRVGGVIDAEQRAVVEAEIRGLADDYARGGAPGARRARSTSASQTRPTATRSTCSPTPTAAASPATSRNWPPTVARRTPAGPRSTSTAPTARSRPRSRRSRVHLPQRRAACSSAATSPPAPPSTARSAARCSGRWRRSSRSRARHRLAPVAAGAAAASPRSTAPPAAIMAGALDRRVALRGTARRVRPARRHAQRHARPDRDAGARPAHRHRQPRPRPAQPARPAGAPPRGRRRRGRPRPRRGRPASSRRCARPRACSPPRRRSSTSRASRPGSAPSSSPRSTLGRLAADVAELYEAAAEERGLALACDAAARPRGARPRPAPGARRCRTSSRTRSSTRPPAATIDVAARLDAGRPALVVGDRGPGIPAADRARALGRFVRLDPSRGSPGAGLGLALVAAVARMHGAEIVLADNAPGLRATLRFPAPEAPALPPG